MSETIRSGRRSIAISSPEKVMFPKPGLTKLDLARHYERVGGLMKPLLRDRPLTFEVFPDGIESEGYYMKSVPRHFPDWIGRTKVAKRGGSLTQVLAADAATLVYLAGQNMITPHAWGQGAAGKGAESKAAKEVHNPISMKKFGIPSTWFESPHTYGNRRVKAQERGLDICAREGARTHVNAIGGRALHATAAFRERGIEFRFVQPRAVQHAQFGATFVPNLSVVNVLMFNAADRVRALLGECDLL